jgi:1,4-dihydroxy-2-naphthoate octaprenyltransferase
MLPRLLRAQFTPIMAAPVILGTAVAFDSTGKFAPAIFLLALAGSLCLHLAANGIDDVYDYLNGTDKITEKLFPPQAPGWKPIPRGVFSVGDAFKVSYLLYAISLGIGVVLSVLVGWLALVIAVPGILLSYFYTAPPLRLDYRGWGLGETSVLFSFGPIPALGAYYVMTGQVSALPFLVAVPSGLLTTAVLVFHDVIYHDVYSQAGKRSLAVVLGRRRATILGSSLSAAAYLILAFELAGRLVPIYGAIAFAAIPIFLKLADFRGKEGSMPEYGSRTTLAFLDSTLFTLLLAAGVLLG